MSDSATVKARWKMVTIDCSNAFRAEHGNKPLPPVDSVMDLAFLKDLCLAKGKEFFLASLKLYIRQEMHAVMNILTDTKRCYKQILIGSPGVGKSLLLFILAFWRAAVQRQKVLYVRKPNRDQECTSIFYLEPSTDGLTVLVHYDRYFDPSISLSIMDRKMCPEVMSLERQEYIEQKIEQKIFYVLDGPLAGSDDLKDFRGFHYLATSGGYPPPKGENRASTAIICLGAWERDELEKALSELQKDETVSQDHDNHSEPDELEKAPSKLKIDEAVYQDQASRSDFDEIYFHTGGRIRDVYTYLENKDKFRTDCENFVGGQDFKALELAVTSTQGAFAGESKDSIRTMFSSHDHRISDQVVDSQFIINLLWKHVETGVLLGAYQFAAHRGLMSAAGCHFEEMMHSLFGPHGHKHPANGFWRGGGPAREGLQMFDKANMYWIPSVPNFANIDAAMVVNGTLYCFQYTIATTHNFNANSFRTSFFAKIPDNMKLPVVLLFVVPKTVPFTAPVDKLKKEWKHHVIRVDCQSTADVERTLFPFKENRKPKKPRIESKPHPSV